MKQKKRKTKIDTRSEKEKLTDRFLSMVNKKKKTVAVKVNDLDHKPVRVILRKQKKHKRTTMPATGIESYLSFKDFNGMWNLKKNIIYNLKYLNHMAGNINTLDSTDAVIVSQTYKLFVVVAGSIVEAIMFGILSEASALPKTDGLIEAKKQTLNGFALDGKTYKVTMRFFTQGDPKEKEVYMFDELRKTLETKKSTALPNADSKLFQKLHRLQTLRNKIHLHTDCREAGAKYTNDFVTFTRVNYDLAKAVLVDLLAARFGAITPKAAIGRELQNLL